MKVSVVIPIFNPPDSFFTTVIPLISTQSIPPEIILINSGNEIPLGPYTVITIPNSEFNHANTRNLALQLDCDFLLYMTQDATPFDSYLIALLIDSFHMPDIVVAYARQIPYVNASPIEKFSRGQNYPEKSCIKSIKNIPQMGIKTFYNSDSCAMYRMDYFKSVHGFTPDLNTNEDMEFAARAIMSNYSVAYNAKARVYHSHNFSYLDLWKRYRRIGLFYKTNTWIKNSIIQHSSTESIGISQAMDELRYLVKNAPHCLIDSFLRSWIKFIAFKF